MLRLRQVFAAKMAEFCEALSAILSVKVAFYNNRQVRVTLQYDLGTAFVFQPALWDAAKDSVGNNSGVAQMQLVAQREGGPQELPQLMRNWGSRSSRVYRVSWRVSRSSAMMMSGVGE